MMDTAQKAKEILRLLDEVESLIPDIRNALSRISSPVVEPLLIRLESLHAKAVRLREGTDCLPAAELGRKGPA